MLQRLVLKARTYQGEGAGRTLANYLNGNTHETEAGRRRVIKIVESYRQLQRLLKKYPPAEWKTARSAKELGLLAMPPGLKSVPLKPDEVREAENSLLELVHRYEQTLTFGVANTGECDFSWGIPLARDANWENEEIVSESRVVDAIVELSRDGLLDRILKCECGTWLYAKFSSQQFCSVRCRSLHKQRSPEFKAKRRNYMREYYQVQKKNVK